MVAYTDIGFDGYVEEKAPLEGNSLTGMLSTKNLQENNCAHLSGSDRTWEARPGTGLETELIEDREPGSSKDLCKVRGLFNPFFWCKSPLSLSSWIFPEN